MGKLFALHHNMLYGEFWYNKKYRDMLRQVVTKNDFLNAFTDFSNIVTESLNLIFLFVGFNIIQIYKINRTAQLVS